MIILNTPAGTNWRSPTSSLRGRCSKYISSSTNFRMENANPVLSLLEKISARQVQDLIFEHKLLQKGYRLYYALDNHDIHKYCFPGNLSGTEFERNADGKYNYELESDRITAYEELFS